MSLLEYVSLNIGEINVIVGDMWAGHDLNDRYEFFKIEIDHVWKAIARMEEEREEVHRIAGMCLTDREKLHKIVNLLREDASVKYWHCPPPHRSTVDSVETPAPEICAPSYESLL